MYNTSHCNSLIQPHEIQHPFVSENEVIVLFKKRDYENGESVVICGKPSGIS